MSIRHWFRQQLLKDDGPGDVPPGRSLFDALLGREQERVRSLGEYDSTSYPRDLADLLRRRAEVAQELLAIDVTDPRARVDAIPQLQQMLRRYPHPLVYEMLIHAYMDADRYDEAKGVAFAARERRIECSRSPFPEVRTEVGQLREWSVEEIDDLRREREEARARRSPEQ